MLKLNENEWQVVLNAYLYEVEDAANMSDSSYDYFAEQVARQNSINIPGFNRSTGQWIYKIVEKYPQIARYARNLVGLGEGTAIRHVVPTEFIRSFNEKTN